MGLVAKILVVSGVIFLVVGAFVVLFANTVLGIVLLAVGVSDLAASAVLSRNSSKRG